MNSKFVVAAIAAISFSAPALAQDAFSPRVELRFGLDRISGAEGGGPVAQENHETDLFVGGEVGLDAIDFDWAQVGVYAGVDFSRVERCEELLGNDQICAQAGRNIYFGVRPGVIVNPGLTVYGKGGLSFARLRGTYTDFDNVIPSVVETEGRTGFHLGAGAEFALRGNFYVKGEFVHTRYILSGDRDDDFVRNQLLGGVGFRF